MKELNYFQSWLSVHFWSFGQFIKHCTVCNVWIVCNIRSLRVSFRKKKCQNTCQLNWLPATFWASHKRVQAKLVWFPSYLSGKSEKKGPTNSWLGWGSIQNKGGADLLKTQGKSPIRKYFVNYILQRFVLPPHANIARTADFVPCCDILSLERLRTKMGLSPKRLSLTCSGGWDDTDCLLQGPQEVGRGIWKGTVEKSPTKDCYSSERRRHASKGEPREVGRGRKKGSDQQREVNTEYQPVNLHCCSTLKIF